jgi:S-adenosylmethionine:tRNA ribosyltransferase-isomerase
VTSARLRGRRKSGGAIEALLVEALDETGRWHCLTRNAQRVRVGERTCFAPDLEGVWGEHGRPYRQIRFEADGDLSIVLGQRGELPLPPYIHRPAGASPEDHIRYQTIFARVPGAVAAPTAGLHFTPALLERLARRDIRYVPLTLLVGPGTFLPVRAPSIEAHRVPPERYAIPETTAAAVAAARAAGGRIIAVGTTVARALESAACGGGIVRPGAARTDLVITPGHHFRVVDGLLTNLHLPRSSLLALVAAFGGVEATLGAYRAASRAGYRFYSYGDAMLIQ